VVDSLQRLRGLLKQMPGSKNKSPGLQVFLRNTDMVEDLRNMVQHLNHEIDNLVDQNEPVFGTLSWFTVLDPTVLDPANSLVASCSLVPGTLFVKEDMARMDMSSGEVDLPVDLIVLSVSEYSVNLSDAMKRVAQLIASMEGELKEQFSRYSVAGADLLLAVHVQLGNTEPGKSANP
jgi:hypothetical protein